MAEMQIVGIRKSTGNFEGRDYNNLMLHCVVDPDDKTFGNSVEVVKAPMTRIGKLLEICKEDYSKLIGIRIDPIYDRNGRFERLFICE